MQRFAEETPGTASARARARHDGRAAWTSRDRRATEAVVQAYAKELSAHAHRGISDITAAPPQPLRTVPALARPAAAPNGDARHTPNTKEAIFMFSRKATRLLAIGASASVLGGGAYGIVSATASTTTTSVGNAAAPAQIAAAAGRGNARSGPAEGGSSGTVVSVSKSSFTIETTAGQKVTVERASSTKYRKGTSASSASALAKGDRILVLGRTNGTTITAAKVVIEPGKAAPATPTAAEVVPLERGTPSTSKQAGQIPASYVQGSGAIATGSTADRATEAALAAYPGGIVDRVVKLSNGDFEVHNIGVGWPHHVFVSSTFEVLGAD
jgi:Domain of unknown function (DUF5666)